MQREDTYSDNALTCRDEVCSENDSIFRVSRGENWRDGTICELRMQQLGKERPGYVFSYERFSRLLAAV